MFVLRRPRLRREERGRWCSGARERRSLVRCMRCPAHALPDARQAQIDPELRPPKIPQFSTRNCARRVRRRSWRPYQYRYPLPATRNGSATSLMGRTGIAEINCSVASIRTRERSSGRSSVVIALRYRIKHLCAKPRRHPPFLSTSCFLHLPTDFATECPITTVDSQLQRFPRPRFVASLLPAFSVPVSAEILYSIHYYLSPRTSSQTQNYKIPYSLFAFPTLYTFQK